VVFAELLGGRLVVCCCDRVQLRAPCDDIAPPLRVLSAWSHACPALLQLVPQQHTTRCDVLMFLVHPRMASSPAQRLHSAHGMQLQTLWIVFYGCAQCSHLCCVSVFWRGSSVDIDGAAERLRRRCGCAPMWLYSR
jgi:hypothetical protein